MSDPVQSHGGTLHTLLDLAPIEACPALLKAAARQRAIDSAAGCQRRMIDDSILHKPNAAIGQPDFEALRTTASTIHYIFRKSLGWKLDSISRNSSGLPLELLPDKLALVVAPVMSIAARTGSFLLLADLAVAQICCGLQPIVGQHDGAVSAKLIVVERDAKELELALGEARQSIVAQMMDVGINGSSLATGENGTPTALHGGALQGSASLAPTGTSSAHSPNATPVPVSPATTAGGMARARSNPSVVIETLVAAGNAGIPTVHSTSQAHAARLARRQAAYDPVRRHAFVTPSDRERAAAGKPLSLAMTALELLARASRATRIASGANGPGAHNRAPTTTTNTSIDIGINNFLNPGTDKDGGEQLEGAPFMPEASIEHLRAVSRLVLSLALLLRVGAGHGPDTAVQKLNEATSLGLLRAATSLGLTMADRDRGQMSSTSGPHGAAGGSADSSPSMDMDWTAPVCGARPDAIASAGAAVAGLAETVQLALVRGAQYANTAIDAGAHDAGNAWGVQLAGLSAAIQELAAGFEAAFRSTLRTDGAAPLCLDKEADMSAREARAVLRGAGASLQRLQLTTMIHAGGQNSALQLVQGIRAQMEHHRPGQVVPPHIVNLVRRLPEALASAPASSLGGALMSAANLLSYTAFRGIVLGEPNWDAVVGGTRAGVDTSDGPDLGALLRQASEGGPRSRRKSTTDIAIKSKQRLEMFGVAVDDEPLGLSADGVGGGTAVGEIAGSMSSASFRVFSLEVWRGILLHPRIGTRVSKGVLDFVVSQLLFHLPLMLARMSPDIARAQGNRDLPRAPLVAEKTVLAGIATTTLQVLSATLANSPCPLARDSVAESSQLEFALQACLSMQDAAMAQGPEPASTGRWTASQAALCKLRMTALGVLEQAVFSAFRDWTAYHAYPAVRCGSLLRSPHIIQALLQLRSDSAALSYSDHMAMLRTAAAGQREMGEAKDAGLQRIARLLQAAVGAFGPALDERWHGIFAPPASGGSGLPPLLPLGPIPGIPGRSAELRSGPLGSIDPSDFVEFGLCQGTVLATISDDWVVVKPQSDRAMVQSKGHMATSHPAGVQAVRKAAWDAAGHPGELESYTPQFGAMRPAYSDVATASDPSLSPMRCFGHVLIRRVEAQALGIIPTLGRNTSQAWGRNAAPHARVAFPSPSLWVGRYRAVQRGPAAPMPPRGFPGAYAGRGPGPELVTPPLVTPVGMKRVGTLDSSPPVAVFQPQPPPGYVALGCVTTVQMDPSHAPPLDSVWCVHEQLIVHDDEARPAGLLVPWHSDPDTTRRITSGGDGTQDDRRMVLLGSSGVHPFEVGGQIPNRFKAPPRTRLLQLPQSQFVLWQLIFDMHRSVGLHGLTPGRQAIEGAMAYRGQDLLTLALALRRIGVLHADLQHSHCREVTRFTIGADSEDALLILAQMGNSVFPQSGWIHKAVQAWCMRPMDMAVGQALGRVLYEEVKRARSRPGAMSVADLLRGSLGLAGTWWGLQTVRDQATEVLAQLHGEGSLEALDRDIPGAGMALMKAAEAMHPDPVLCPQRHRLLEDWDGELTGGETGCCMVS